MNTVCNQIRCVVSAIIFADLRGTLENTWASPKVNQDFDKMVDVMKDPVKRWLMNGTYTLSQISKAIKQVSGKDVKITVDFTLQKSS